MFFHGLFVQPVRLGCFALGTCHGPPQTSYCRLSCASVKVVTITSIETVTELLRRMADYPDRTAVQLRQCGL